MVIYLPLLTMKKSFRLITILEVGKDTNKEKILLSVFLTVDKIAFLKVAENN